jgi:uncharacterized integral membrane protein
MRTIKTVLLIVIAVVVMLVMAANMAKVDLHLLPTALAANGWSVTAPLAAVIVASVLTGIVLGLLIEFLREAKHRHRLTEKRAEIARLKAENARLSRQAGIDGDDLPGLAS